MMAIKYYLKSTNFHQIKSCKKPTPVRTSTVTLQGQAPPTKIPFLYGLSAAYIHAEITGQLRTVPADHIPEIWVLTASHTWSVSIQLRVWR